ncbi:MAG: MDR family MFS transporter [Promethearchaeota archaeon]
MFTKLKETYSHFHPTFWMVALASFVDQIGNYIIMPFISLFITSKFDVGLTQVGIIFVIVGIGNMVGGIFGGALTDKMGRKSMILFGLVVSGTFSIVIIFVESLTTLYIVILVMGILGSIGGPARSAMMADVLPPEKRTEGFGILRITMNIAATVGPLFGGFLAVGDNYDLLFIADAVLSVITGLLFFFLIPETKPQVSENGDTSEPTMKESMGGYKEVLRDGKFLLFVLVSSIMGLVYQQMQTTLSVFLRDSHGFSAQNFGFLIALNAIMVVVLQYWVTKKIKKYAAFLMMAVGNLMYGLGFGMYGFVATVPLFFLAMVIITFGEMVVAPFGQTIAANFAPEDKRGRYMAVQQWGGLIPMLFGVLGAGLIMDNLNPNLVWLLAAILSVVAALGYVYLYFVVKPEEMKGSSSESPSIESPSLESSSPDTTGSIAESGEVSIL